MHRRYRYRYINQPDTITDTVSINVTYVMVCKVMQRSRYKNSQERWTPTFLTVSERSGTLMERSCKRSGTMNAEERNVPSGMQRRLGTNSGKRSRSGFKNERNIVVNCQINLVWFRV
jgi:hypothetical protein